MRLLATLLLSLLLLWAAGFAVFLVLMARPATPLDQHADALIVLTGGSKRLERGFDLLANDAAPVLFISGVGEKVTLQQVLDVHATPAERAAIEAAGREIVLDHAANSTQTNAEQAAAFVRARHYHSIRLITGHYHMPRSLVEFHAALPDVAIYREPVVPDSLAAHWWEDAGNRRLILQEFHKFLAANGRNLLAHL